MFFAGVSIRLLNMVNLKSHTMEDFSRRRFIKNMSVGGSVIGTGGISGMQSNRQDKTDHDNSLPRQVWIASMNLQKIKTDDQ